MPVPESLARLMVSARGGGQTAPGMLRMVEGVGEDGLPQMLVGGGADEVVCTAAGLAEAHEVVWGEMCQDELEQLGSKVDQGFRRIHVGGEKTKGWDDVRCHVTGTRGGKVGRWVHAYLLYLSSVYLLTAPSGDADAPIRRGIEGGGLPKHGSQRPKAR